MRSVLVGSLCVCLSALAQEPASSAPTVDQIIEKSIAAAGGREAMKKMTSLAGSGTFELTSMGATGTTEVWAKAPDKRLSVTTVEGYGEVKQGYDGKVAWKSDPQGGLANMEGDELFNMRREAQFNGELRWKELYSNAEVIGKNKVGDRDCWVLKLTPNEGKPMTRYYDAETFQLMKVVTDTPQGETVVMPSDYADIGNGVKIAHTLKLTLPQVGDLVIKFKEFKPNVDIDDAKFTKPAN